MLGVLCELTRISEDDKLVLRNLLHLYLYDLSEFKRSDVNGHGFFEYPRLDQYWTDNTCHPFFILVQGHIAGFVLIYQNDSSTERRSVISEFFVMRKYRRMGVGRYAARSALELFPGAWEVSEIPENLPSQVFWRMVIQDVTHNTCHDSVINGRPTQHFEVSSPKVR